MKNYRITIELVPISYEIQAESEEKAKEYAKDCFFDETIYDIFENAELQIQQLEGILK
jgi:hypothetical protein